MLKRKKQKDLSDQFREAIWPKMGWIRLFKYYGLKLYRLNDSPYAIASGLSCGIAMSFTPFIGLHLVFSAFLSRVFNGSLIASLIGTLAGNPWTFPIIWFLTYKIGMFVLGTDVTTPDAAMMTADHLPTSFSLSSMLDKPKEFFVPMLIGSIPCAISAWIVSFFFTRNIVINFQRRRFRRRAKARLKEMRRAQKRLDRETLLDKSEDTA